MAEEFKISLGAELKPDASNDLNTQIDRLNLKPIQLTINDRDFNTKLNSIRSQINGIQTNPIPLQMDDRNVLNQLDNIRQQIQDLGNITINLGGNNNRGIGNTVNTLQRAFREVYNLSKQISSMELKIGKLNMSGVDANNIAQYTRQLNVLRATYQALLNSLNGQNVNLDDVFTQLDRSRTEIAQLSSVVDDARTKLASDIKINIANGDLSNQVSTIENRFNRLNMTNANVVSGITELRRLLGTMDASDDIESITDDYQVFKQVLETITNQVEDLQRMQKNDIRATGFENDRNALSSQIDVWLKDHSAAAAKFGAQLNDLKNRLRSCDEVEFKNLKAEFQEIKRQAKLADVATKTWSDKLKDQFKEYGVYLSASTMIAQGVRALQSMYENVVEIDSAMTDLLKVTDETDEAYQRFLNNAGKNAQELGRTVSSFVQQSAEWAKMGFDTVDSSELAKVSSIYSNVADVDDATAVSDIVTAMKAFNIEAENAISIIDPMNKISNEFAVTAAGLGQGLSRSASTMATAGTDLEHTLALLTGISEITQSPEEAGNFLKTAIARIQGMKGKLEELGEEVDESVDSISKVQTQILNLTSGTSKPVNIFDESGNFRDYYDIMKDIADIVDELESTDRAQLYEILFGKNRMNQGAAMIQAFQSGQIEKALSSALDSTGSATAEQEKWMESLEAKIQKLQAAWQELSRIVVDSDLIADGLDIITDFVDGLDNIIDKAGLLPTLIGGISAAMSFKNKGLFKTVEDEANLSGKRITNIFSDAFNAINDFKNASFSYNSSFATNLQNDTSAIRAYITEVSHGMSVNEAFERCMLGTSAAAQQYVRSMEAAHVSVRDFELQQKMLQLSLQAQNKSWTNCKSLIAGYNDAVNSTGMTQQQFIASISQSNSSLAKYLTGLNGANGSIKGYIASLIGTKAATIGLQIATAALNAGISMLVSAALTWVINKISDFIHREEILIEKSEEAANTIKSLSDSFKETETTVSDISKRFAELSQEVDSLSGKNLSLSTDDYEEFLDLSNQLAELFPTLPRIYDENGNAIVQLSGGVDTIVQSLQNLLEVQRQLANQEIADNLPDLYGGVKINSNTYNDELKKAEEQRDITEKQLKLLQDPNTLSNINKFLDTGIIESDNLEELHRTTDAYLDVLREFGIEIDKVNGHFQNSFDEYGNINKSTFEYFYIPTNKIEEVKERIAVGIQDVAHTYTDEIANLNNEIQSSINENKGNWSSLLPSIFAWLTTESSYQNIENNDLKSVIQAMINNIDFNSLNFENWSQLESHIKTNIIEPLKNAEPEVQQAYSELFSIKYDNKTTLEYVSAIKNKAREIAENSDFSYNEILKDTGYQDIIDQYEENANDIISVLNDSIPKQYENYEEGTISHFRALEGYNAQIQKLKDNLYNLTPDELKRALNLIQSEDIQTWEELNAALERVQLLEFDFNLKDEIEGIENLKTALEETVSGTGLSSESIANLKNRYQDLDGYDPAKLFEKTANGVQLNTKELNKLESAYEDFNNEKIDEELESLVDEYNDLTKEIDLCNDAAKRESLLAQRDDIKDKIDEVATLAAQYDGLTSAYNKWITAQSDGDERDRYSNIAKSREDIEEEMSRGWLDEGTKKYIDLLSSEDLSNAGYEEYVNAWKKLKEKIGNSGYSILDFFTLDDDGNETSEGIYNFFETVQQELGKSYARIDEETGKWTFDFDGLYNTKTGQTRLEHVAEKLKIDVEIIQAILDAAEDAGFEVDYGALTDGLELAQTDFEKLADKAKEANDELKKLNKTETDFKFGTNDIETVESELQKAQELYDSIINKDGSINLDAEGAEEARWILGTLIIEKQKIEEPAIMSISIDATQAQTDTERMVALLQDLYTYYNEYEYQLKLGGDTSEAQESITNTLTKIDELEKNSDISILAKLGIDVSSWDAAVANFNTDIEANAKISEESLTIAKDEIQALDSEVILDFIKKDDSAKQYYDSITDKDVTFTFKKNSWAIDNYLRTLEGKTVRINIMPTGINQVDGTAHVQGSAFANGTTGRAFKRGDWGIKDSGIGLGGELGQELVVRNGRFFTIGDKSAEFFRYQKGDIIFNAQQTKEIFEKGKITHGNGRGRALAGGTAFAEGRAFNGEYNASGSGPSENDISNLVDKNPKKSGSTKKSKTDKNSTKEFKETFDWIEIAIDRIERAISRLDQKANSTYKSWSSRNKNLEKEISKVGEEIDLQEQAYNRYIQEANSVGLSESWAKKVREGKVDIETITDEDLADKISQYEEWYTKAIDAKDAIAELKETEAELYEQSFDNIVTQYEGILSVLEHDKSMLEESISQSEAKGYIVSTEYYDALIKTEQSNIDQLKNERTALINSLNEAVASGTIKEGSESWVNMRDQINATTLAIEQGETALIEYNNSIRDTEWRVFDLLQEKISQVTSESDFLIDLMSNDKLYDDRGQLTDEGMATMGLHGQNYNTYMAQADKYAEEILNIDKELAEDPYNQDLVDRRQELLELQQESILAAEDEEQAIVDMVKEGIELELSALQELIDSYTDALDSQKDLYDYQKKISKQTSEISILQKQLLSYEGDDSEETRAKIQELRVSFSEAKENLQESEYDRYISDQKSLLDELYNEYSEVLNQRLDNVDQLLSDMITEINTNASIIYDALVGESNSVGYTLSEAMNTIWNTGGEGDTAKSVLTTYGSGIQNSITTASTTLASALNSLGVNIQNMMSDLDNQANEDIEGTPDSNNPTVDPTPTTTTTPTTTQTPKEDKTKTPKKDNDEKDTNKNIFDYKKNSYPKSKLNVDKFICSPQ